MRRFKDFLNEAGVPAPPRAPMPTPGVPGLNLPNLYAHPMPLGGFRSAADAIRHRQEQETPDLRVVSSIARLTQNLYSNPTAYGNPQFRGNDVLGIPMDTLVNPTSLSAGEGKMTASQIRRATELRILSTPSSLYPGDTRYFDLHVAALKSEMQKQYHGRRLASGAGYAVDQGMNLMLTPGAGAQQLQRAQNSPL